MASKDKKQSTQVIDKDDVGDLGATIGPIADDAADNTPSPMERAAKDSGLAIRGGSVEIDESQVTDLAEVLDDIDPQAIKTQAADMVGRSIVVFAWATHSGSEKYRNEDGEITDYAVLGFYFTDDEKRKARFLSTGGARLVPAVQAAIALGRPALPIRTKLVSYEARRGTGYRFARAGE